MMSKLYEGDCLEVLKELPDSSVDSIVTDPPYGLEFMGKDWDAPWKVSDVSRANRGTLTNMVNADGKPKFNNKAPAFDLSRKASKGFQEWCESWAKECLRVLKPGGYLLAFGGTRTYHRMACAIEDAGFEVRDSIHWVYGSGFPKGLDVSKAVEKAGSGTSEAQRWGGWGTALKPAHEPIVMARKPLAGTVANNVLEYGTGALNIDGCRVGDTGGTPRDGKADQPNASGWENMRGHGIAELNAGRWPTNVLFSHLPECDENTCADGCAVVEIDAQSDFGGASRFFPVFRYQAKPARKERDEGLWDLPGRAAENVKNFHPTVKPVDLMLWLVRLVTPPKGTVMDPFMGSGTTGVAAVEGGFEFVGIERDPDYMTIARTRINETASGKFDMDLLDELPQE